MGMSRATGGGGLNPDYHRPSDTTEKMLSDNGLLLEDISIPYKLDWDTDEFEEGAHTLKAIAHDTSGQTAFDQIQLTIDRTPPTVELAEPSWHLVQLRMSCGYLISL